MKKRGWLILIVSAAALLLLAAPGLAEDSPVNVYVDNGFFSDTAGWGETHFDKIQDGIDAVSAGGTVYVAAGSYCENVSISKDNLTIMGEDGAILDGDFDESTGTGFFVTAQRVMIKGFRIENCEYGVYLDGGGNRIRDNVITDNVCGVFNAGDGNRVNYNYISGNSTGLQNDSVAVIDATMNWWGDISGPSHDGYPSGAGDSITDNVDYDPWIADEEADYSEGTRIMLVANGVNYARASFLEDAPFAFPIIITITIDEETDGWVAFIVCNPADHEAKGLPAGVDPLLLAGYNLACIESSFDSAGLPVQLEIILVEDIADLEDFDADELPSDLVKLYRYEDGAWRSLGGTLVVEDGKLIFRAEFTGLSLFGIFLNILPEEPGADPASEALPRTNGALPLTGLACMAMLAAGAAILHKRRRC
ncbi:MAG: NosD domain-containing protein [Bacillota bacterium]